MDHDEALAALGDGDSETRLAGARQLYLDATSSDRPAIAVARARETNRYVLNALDDALARLDVAASLSAAPGGGEQDDDATRTKAFDEAIRVCLHEIRTIIGDLRDEISQVPGDLTGVVREVDRLSRLLKGLENLTRAGEPAEAIEFDLSELVRSIATSDLGASTARIELAGPRTLIVTGDPYRVELALRNGVKNALESVSDVKSDGKAPGTAQEVLISWDESDGELWVVVLDRGIGLPAGFERAFELGRSSKPEAIHFGLGLTIAQRAARSIGGRVALAPRDDGGASFELRWPGSGVRA